VRSIVIGTAGHIDHGKSALVRALTGTDPDRLKEEQERGITIDLGFAHLQEEGASLAFVDVPGHERFVKNMLAGVGGTDLVMLVVAADESVMPQTREHFQICRLLNVPAGLVVLTKSDLVDRDTLDLVALEVRDLVRGSFLESAPVLPVSSRTGEGMDRLRAALVSLAAGPTARHADGPVRLPIDRVFSSKGFGTIVTGTLVSGTVRVDQELVVLPAGRAVKVRGLQMHGQRSDAADAGRRVAVNLGGVEIDDLSRGDTLCEGEAFESTRRLDVLLELLADGPTLRPGARVRFHHGTSELLGRISIAGPTDNEARRSYARIRLESPAVLTRGDRFIVRAYSPLATAGGGVVLDPQPPPGATRTAAALERYRRIDPGAGEDSALSAFIDERGPAGLHRADLICRAGLTRPAAAAALDRLGASAAATRVGELLVSPRTLADLGARLVKELEAHHASHPLSDGMPREEARDRIFRRASPAVFEWVLAQLSTAGRLVGRDRLALQGHQVSLTPEEARAHNAVERVYREAGLSPPDRPSAASAAGVAPAVFERVTALLLRTRVLVPVEGMIFHAGALEELKAEIRALKGEGSAPRVDVAAFKGRYGITRKFAIPLLEYLDRERVTRRVGEARIVL
jgi:selenocysteine-specific elongation factor